MVTNRYRGFTLIELSIVLVIIGLIVGGILVGKELVQAATLRAVMSEVERFNAAINTFRSKYNCVPGDCADASTFFPTALDGNGDGLVGPFPYGNVSEEPQVWYQLALAGLISGSYTGTATTGCAFNFARHMIPGVNVPASKFGNSTGYTLAAFTNYTDGNDWSPSVWTTINQNLFMFGAATTNCETYAPALSPADAYSIDSKMDDGQPGTGRVRVFFPRLFGNCVTTTDPSSSAYSLTLPDVLCQLLFLTSGS